MTTESWLPIESENQIQARPKAPGQRLGRPGQPLDDFGLAAPEVEIDDASGCIIEDKHCVRRTASSGGFNGESNLNQRAGE
jgi:hypothetical protein